MQKKKEKKEEINGIHGAEISDDSTQDCERKSADECKPKSAKASIHHPLLQDSKDMKQINCPNYLFLIKHQDAPDQEEEDEDFSW